MIQIGCCAFCFKGARPDGVFALLGRMGFKYVSVGLNHADSQINPLRAAIEPQRLGKHIRELAHRHGLQLAEAFMCALQVDEKSFVVPNHPDKALRQLMLERFKPICDCVAEAGFRNLMGVPGTPQPTLPAGDEWTLAMETLSRMCEIAAARGVCFTVEPHRGSIVHDVKLIDRMLAEVPALRLTLDYAHFTGKGVGEKQLLHLHERTVHLHARPARPGAYSCPLAEDAIDFPTVLADLADRGWDGIISTECFGDPATEKLDEHPAIQNAVMAAKLAGLLRARPA